MPPHLLKSRPLASALVLWSMLAAVGPVARAQRVPPIQTPPLALPVPEVPAPPPTVDQLAARLRALEATNKALTGQLDELHQRLTEISRRVGDPPSEMGLPIGDGTGGAPVPDYTEEHFDPFEFAPGYPASNVESPYRFPLRTSFGPGFLFQTEDDRFRLQIHYESQIEGRVWGRDDQIPANSGLFLPRQRIFFDGHITKWVEYEFAINRGLNNINLLNAYINLHLDDRLQFRFGRFFTPLNYDQYAISNYWLPTPERSLFTTNVGLNRQIGAMAWGYLFDERLDYSVGVFNGSRNSFESLSNNVDFVGYLNARPFQEVEALPFARFLNVGTSVAVGRQDQSPVPVSFRIGGGSPDANIPGIATVPFLILNPDAAERGNRLVGSVHAAYFFRGLSLIGEWQYGHGSYASSARPSSVRVPYSGFYVSWGYFLTGERIERRTRLKPRRPFIPVNKDEKRGLGAWEIAGRVSQLQLGDEIFRSGFADPTIWSGRATTTELGVNWYWNEYIKVYTFWAREQLRSHAKSS